MPCTAEAVANGLLEIAERAEEQISPMKLQKLVYYTHGWHLAIRSCPMIQESVQAWEYGPVIPSLYHEFKEFGRGLITRKARELRWSEDEGLIVYDPSVEQESDEPAFAQALMERMWEVYGGLTSIQLSKMTHANGTPWHQVASKYNFKLPAGLNIPNDLIEDHFRARLKRSAQ